MLMKDRWFKMENVSKIVLNEAERFFFWHCERSMPAWIEIDIGKRFLIIGWCRVGVAIIASKIFSLDFFQALRYHLLSSLSQVKHELILWFKLQAPNSSLCYNISASFPNLSILTSDINTNSQRNLHMLPLLHICVYALSVCVLLFLKSVFYQKNKTQTQIFKRV